MRLRQPMFDAAYIPGIDASDSVSRPAFVHSFEHTCCFETWNPSQSLLRHPWIRCDSSLLLSAPPGLRRRVVSLERHSLDSALISWHLGGISRKHTHIILGGRLLEANGHYLTRFYFLKR